MEESKIKLLVCFFGILIMSYIRHGQSLAQQIDKAHNPFGSVMEVQEEETNSKNPAFFQKDSLIANPINKSKLKEKKKDNYKDISQQKTSNVKENVSMEKMPPKELKQKLRKTDQEIKRQNLPKKATHENQKAEKLQKIVTEYKPILLGVVKTKNRNFALIQIDENRFWVEEGHYLGQAELIEIQEEQIILQKGQETKFVKLRY